MGHLAIDPGYGNGSSSYVFIGELVAAGKDVLEIDISKYRCLVAVGRTLVNGTDVFNFTQGHQDVLKRIPPEKQEMALMPCFVFELLKSNLDQKSFTLTKNEFSDNKLYHVISGDCDNDCSETPERLEFNLKWHYVFE